MDNSPLNQSTATSRLQRWLRESTTQSEYTAEQRCRLMNLDRLLTLLRSQVSELDCVQDILFELFSLCSQLLLNQHLTQDSLGLVRCSIEAINYLMLEDDPMFFLERLGALVERRDLRSPTLLTTTAMDSRHMTSDSSPISSARSLPTPVGLRSSELRSIRTRMRAELATKSWAELGLEDDTYPMPVALMHGHLKASEYMHDSKVYTLPAYLISRHPFVACMDDMAFDKAAGKVMVTYRVHTEPFALLSLPPELRLMIYNILHSKSGASKVLHLQHRKNYDTLWVDPWVCGVLNLLQLMQTNRFLQKEVGHFIYSNYQFICNDFATLSQFLRPQKLRPALSRIDQLGHVRVNMPRIGARLDVVRIVEQAFSSLSKCFNLKKLKLAICCEQHAIDALERRVSHFLIPFCEAMDCSANVEGAWIDIVDFVPLNHKSPCHKDDMRLEEDGPNALTLEEKDCIAAKDWLIKAYDDYYH